MLTIYPTHNCFDDAGAMLVELALEGRTKVVLVHAILRVEGRDYAHAWIEDDGVVWQRGIVNKQLRAYGIETAMFKRTHCIIDSTEYTVDQACEMSQRLGGSGPWVDRYVALCSDRQEVLGSVVVDPNARVAQLDNAPDS